ncbi:MAG: hypothetical protein PUD93_00455 [Lachnospiraceae bacterium]|nr:hypothetical protein [Lachnospiraceae bacterium]
MSTLKDFTNADVYNRPITCKQCGGVMVFKGVGEYQCEDCGYLDYDDYGKVRNYIERHVGATSAQVSEATGVKQKTIRTMLKESRLEIANGSKAFITCELCGASIRSGRLCSKCEINYNRNVEEITRMRHNKSLMGYSMERPAGEDGAKRFVRDN